MRTLTIVVSIEDTAKAKWIWDSHMSGNEINGVKVGTIAEGDEIKNLESQIESLHCDLAGEDW